MLLGAAGSQKAIRLWVIDENWLQVISTERLHLTDSRSSVH